MMKALRRWMDVAREHFFPRLEINDEVNDNWLETPAADEPADPDEQERVARMRSRQAHALLDTAAFTHAVDAVERTLVQAWIDTPLTASAAREQIWANVQGVRSVRAQLQAMMVQSRLSQTDVAALRRSLVTAKQEGRR